MTMLFANSEVSSFRNLSCFLNALALSRRTSYEAYLPYELETIREIVDLLVLGNPGDMLVAWPNHKCPAFSEIVIFERCGTHGKSISGLHATHVNIAKEFIKIYFPGNTSCAWTSFGYDYPLLGKSQN